MTHILKLRLFLFLFGCIGTRLLFTITSALVKGWYLTLLGLLAFIPVIGWFYIIFIGKRDTGMEVFGDKIWWKQLRPIHMLLWCFFSYLAIHQNHYAWIVLLIDTLFGLSAFLYYHWKQKNLIVMLN